jgi:hypothetical protein
MRNLDIQPYYQGDTIQNGDTIQKTFTAVYKAKEFKTPGRLLYKSTLYTSKEKMPPKYKNDSGSSFYLHTAIDLSVSVLCHITVDLRKLPRGARKRREGGLFFEATYSIGLQFGRQMIFKFMSEAIVLERVNARYT